MKLLEIVRQHIPRLKKAYFWSDGWTAQFHFRFTFCSFRPNDSELRWDYGEAHHFKGLQMVWGNCEEKSLSRCYCI